jgi:ABC-type antimicrobial peptide transport system permease subunit
MAFGATRGRLCLMFLRQAALITLPGCVISFALSLFAGKLIASMLYKFEGFDKGVFFGAAVLLFVIMLLVALIPVRRAVTAEPSESMRDE